MKILALFSIVATMLVAAPLHSLAQTFRTVNAAENIIRKVTTPSSVVDSTITVFIGNGEAGTLEVKVVGLATDAADAVTGTLRYRYSKSASGSLTLSYPIAVDTITVATALSGATFQAVSSYNNIKISLTGKVSKPIRWAVIPKQWYRRND